MTYEWFLNNAKNNTYIVLFSLNGDKIEFTVNNKQDFLNIRSLDYNKVNFNRFKHNKIIEVHTIIKNNN